jgi:hypothetical protein
LTATNFYIRRNSQICGQDPSSHSGCTSAKFRVRYSAAKSNITTLHGPHRLRFTVQGLEKVREEVIELAMKSQTEVTSYSMVTTHSTVSYSSTEKAPALQS